MRPAPVADDGLMQRAQINPARLSSREVMALQRTAGNQATLRLLQRNTQPPAAPQLIQRLVQQPLTAAPKITDNGRFARVIQRDSSNWSKFKNFNSQYGLGGWRADQQWWMDEMNPANNEGVAKVAKPVGVAPFALLQMGLSGAGRGLTSLAGGAYYGARGLGSYAKSGWRNLKDFISSKKKSSWDPRSIDQKTGLIGDTGLSAIRGASSVAGTSANFIDKLTGMNQISVPESIQQADPSLRGWDGSVTNTVSGVGQGFGAATGVLGGLGGLANTFRGVSNIFGRKRQGKGYQRLTRGLGRTGAGLTQAFAGAAFAGKSIATLTGAASPAASFLGAAAVPAQAALSGIDIIKGTYGLAKATKRKSNLRALQKNFKDSDPQKSEFARLAKQYQSKRQVRAGANIAAGALGALGAGLVLGGVSAPIGMGLMGLGGGIKLGASLWGKVRDRTWGKKNAKAKHDKEMQWATLAAKNYKDDDIRAVLEALGAEDKALDIDKLDQMTEEERIRVMYTQLMKR